MLSEKAITAMLEDEKKLENAQEAVSSSTPRNNPELLDKIREDGNR